ncbi:hypothetical protein HMI54_009863 [Coelomomyces lativittatus]|nr:hypothetical protein HMI55_006297 [Coelomomyces lativittatus]KAJ1515165.1 hypothetical protein HMI56_006403 [Coelomomyces lativittatus]KAJ1516326.1 hypothetical protein HMI54_009863 [Coelomomyces lativittatus]
MAAVATVLPLASSMPRVWDNYLTTTYSTTTSVTVRTHSSLDTKKTRPSSIATSPSLVANVQPSKRSQRKLKTVQFKENLIEVFSIQKYPHLFYTHDWEVLEYPTWVPDSKHIELDSIFNVSNSNSNSNSNSLTSTSTSTSTCPAHSVLTILDENNDGSEVNKRNKGKLDSSTWLKSTTWSISQWVTYPTHFLLSKFHQHVASHMSEWWSYTKKVGEKKKCPL